jgi:outer membrane lipoprotein-sorting protein
MKKVRAIYNEKASIETAFTLSIFWKIREKTENKNGKLIVAPHDKFRAEIGNTVFVCNGEILWQYNPDEKGGQVVIKHANDVDISSMPSGLISKYLEKTGYVLKEEKNNITTVEWVATGDINSEARKIIIDIDSKSGIIRKLLVVDKSENESTYTFSKMKTGITPQASTFNYAIPKGASILDLRN